jgi:DNA-directed RNA polymerase specialized sigma24 family protein
MAKANFVDKKKFYEHLLKRYDTVLKVKEKQKRYYQMIEEAEGGDGRKSELNQKVKEMLHRIPIDDFIGDCILKICQNLIRKKGFIEYSQTHSEDMIGDAIENCILYISSFDPRKSSEPFSYFTQVATWAFVRRIEKEKREIYFKLRSLHNMDGLIDSSFQAEHDDTYDGKIMSDDWLIHTRNYVNEYEDKMEKKRNRQRKKKEKKSLVDLFEKKEKINE